MAVEPCEKCGSSERYDNGRCKGCARKSALDAYYRDPDANQARALVWKQANRDRSRRSGRKGGRMDWLPGEHEKAEDALAVAVSCDVCGGDDPHHQRGWNADHSHVTKRFRGIVCHPCNIAVAHVEKFGLDRGEQIRAYLERTS